MPDESLFQRLESFVAHRDFYAFAKSWFSRACGKVGRYFQRQYPTLAYLSGNSLLLSLEYWGIQVVLIWLVHHSPLLKQPSVNFSFKNGELLLHIALFQANPKTWVFQGLQTKVYWYFVISYFLETREYGSCGNGQFKFPHLTFPF